MRIIHCADIHLDSSLSTNFDKEKAIKRNEEILKSYLKMVEYAKQNNVSAIIIAGDLFDANVVNKTTYNIVLDAIRENENIDFFYLKGNHDKTDCFSKVKNLPDNLYTFSEEWTNYEIENSIINICGVENIKPYHYEELELDENCINIVTLHGQVCNSFAKNVDEIIISKLKNKGIDYLALGHIHAYEQKDIDSRGKYCYSGCLEGRGYDESGLHGFVLIDIDEHKHILESEFIPFSRRMIFEIRINVSGLNSTNEIYDRIISSLEENDCQNEDMVKFILEGKYDIENELDINYLKLKLEKALFDVRIVDETKPLIDFSKFEKEQSFMGEFVRTAKGRRDLSEEEINKIIQYGYELLSASK